MASEATADPGFHPEAGDKIEAHVWRIAGVVILGMIMSILDTTIVNVALRTLGHDLHSTISQIQWVVTGYLLSLAAVIPVTGWAARRFGAKRVYLTSLVLFTAGSGLCAIADSTTSLVLFRILQGVGGGMIMPVGQLIMAQVAGPKRMGRVMGVVSMPAMLAPILGPVVGGAILQNLHWSWIFLVNLPIGVIAFILAWRVLPRTDSGAAGRLDVLGLVLLSSASSSTVYGLAQLGSNASLTAPIVILPIIAGLVLTGVFISHAMRVERPLLDVRLYANRVFACGLAYDLRPGSGAVRGDDPGAPLLPGGPWPERHRDRPVDGSPGAGDAARHALDGPSDRTLRRRAGGSGRGLLPGPDDDPAGLRLAHHLDRLDLDRAAGQGVGIGFAFVPAMSAAFASLRPEQLSDATPQLNVLQRIGGAIGTAVLAVVLQRAGGGSHDVAVLAKAFDKAYWWSAGIALLSLIPCFVLMKAENPAARLEPGGGERRGGRRAAGGLSPVGAPAAARPAAPPREAQLAELGLAFKRVFRTLSRIRAATPTWPARN